jgi:hypothetical protein
MMIHCSMWMRVPAGFRNSLTLHLEVIWVLPTKYGWNPYWYCPSSDWLLVAFQHTLHCERLLHALIFINPHTKLTWTCLDKYHLVLTIILNLARVFVLQRSKILRKARSGLSGVVYVQSEPAPHGGWMVSRMDGVWTPNISWRNWMKNCFLSILLDVGGGAVTSWDNSYLKAGGFGDLNSQPLGCLPSVLATGLLAKQPEDRRRKGKRQ